KGGRTHTIYPEKRIYNVGQMPMTEAAIDVSPFRDIYLALGEPLGKRSWSIRMYYKPLVRWIWAGGLMMFVGGIIALLDRRYYRRPLGIPV
ncbi:MAG TPA: cytochrome c-type biogenesis CcmF C-terminal domain-containing protein, partial [Legionellaceae bacterium]|nr:cytochrome c-type biogenesis CcmF C-terminal domain-containing protein [Legionellaceae bacterium]